MFVLRDAPENHDVFWFADTKPTRTLRRKVRFCASFPNVGQVRVPEICRVESGEAERSENPGLTEDETVPTAPNTETETVFGVV